MISIGNVYGHGFDAARVSEVERQGFRLRPGTGRYAGAQVLRFVDFERGPALELIDVADPEAYAAFVPEGMTPYCPGVSLVVPADSPRSLDDFAEAFRGLRPYRLHANYDGSTGPGRPGWNYLNFGVPLVRDTFIWLTALDEPRPARPALADHPNGAIRVRGIGLDVEAEALGHVADIVGRKTVDGALQVGDTVLWSRQALRGMAFDDKRFPLVAVVLEVRDLANPALPARSLAEARFLGEPAVRVRTHPLTWDLVFTEGRFRARGGRR